MWPKIKLHFVHWIFCSCCATLVLLFLQPNAFDPTVAQVPAFELACPAGMGPIPAGQWVNPTTGKIRQYFCIDANGNLVLAGLGNNSLAANGQLQLTGVGGISPALILDGTTGGASLQIGQGAGTTSSISLGSAATVSIWQSTSNFAGLGSVPAAGVWRYCSDCTTAATCAGSGTGHMAVSNGTNWTCQ